MAVRTIGSTVWQLKADKEGRTGPEDRDKVAGLLLLLSFQFRNQCHNFRSFHLFTTYSILSMLVYC